MAEALMSQRTFNIRVGLTLEKLHDEIVDLRGQVQGMQITMQRMLDRLPDDEGTEHYGAPCATGVDTMVSHR